MPKPTTVAEYIKAAPKDSQKKLREIRACLKKAAPKSLESLKWGTPAFSYERILFAYAGFKNHVGFFPTPSAMRNFKKELAGYSTGTSSIKFPLDKPLPIALIRKIAAFRIKELKEKDAKWM